MATPRLTVFEGLSTVVAPFYIPTNNAQEPEFFHVLSLFFIPSALFTLVEKHKQNTYAPYLCWWKVGMFSLPMYFSARFPTGWFLVLRCFTSYKTKSGWQYFLLHLVWLLAWSWLEVTSPWLWEGQDTCSDGCQLWASAAKGWRWAWGYCKVFPSIANWLKNKLAAHWWNVRFS